MDGIDPLAVTTIEEPGRVTIKDKPTGLSRAELNRYAKLTGRNIAAIMKISQKSMLGELAEKLGQANYGSALLLDTEEDIGNAIAQVDKMIDEYPHEPDAVVSLLNIKKGLIELKLRTAHTHIKSKKDSGPDQSQAPPVNIPFPPSVPVQVNIKNEISPSQTREVNV